MAKKPSSAEILANLMAKKLSSADILANLTDPDVEKRIEAARKLGKYKNRVFVRPLIAALQDSEHQVRREAARSLGKIGDPWAVDPLIAILKDDNAIVGRTAAFALGEIRDSHAISALCLALQDNKRTVRENAMLALVQIGASAVGGLAQTISEGREAAKERARYALVSLYEKDKPLITGRIFSDPKLTPQERFQALEAIKNARPRGFMAQFSQWIGNVPQFCADTISSHKTAGTEHTAECKGAESVLQFLTLVRAGQRDSAGEGSELLRGSSADNTPQNADELLRGSDKAQAPVLEARSLWKRLFARKS